jgi:hypothetical protein
MMQIAPRSMMLGSSLSSGKDQNSLPAVRHSMLDRCLLNTRGDSQGERGRDVLAWCYSIVCSLVSFACVSPGGVFYSKIWKETGFEAPEPDRCLQVPYARADDVEGRIDQQDWTTNKDHDYAMYESVSYVCDNTIPLYVK